MTNRVQKIWSSLKQVDVTEFIGEPGELFFDYETGVIRRSDGTTFGGIPVTSAGSASVVFQNTPPANPINGLLWFDPDSDTLFTYDNGAWVAPSLPNLSDVELINTQDGDTLVYNSVTSKFENRPVKLTGGALNQVLVKQSNDDYDYQWEDMIIQLPQQTYTKLIDTVSDLLWYYGEAVPDSITSLAVWRIQQITFDNVGNVESVFFAGSGNFNQVWDNRATLTYS